MINIRILRLCHLCVFNPSTWNLLIQLQFVNFFTYYWARINYCIMKTWYEMWWYSSITIWRTFKINKTCCLSFSTWIHPTYSCVFNIIFINNITSIIICCLIFFIVNLSNLLFWKNTTPIIINIFIYVIRLYIFVIKFFTMM